MVKKKKKLHFCFCLLLLCVVGPKNVDPAEKGLQVVLALVPCDRISSQVGGFFASGCYTAASHDVIRLRLWANKGGCCGGFWDPACITKEIVLIE